MSKICKKCNRKLSFFEKIFDNRYCEQCFEMIKDEEEAIRRKKEEERIKKEEEEKLARLIREIQEKEERLIPEKNYFLYTKYFWSILSNINNLPFHYQDIFKYTVKKDKFKVIELLLEEILIQLPKDYNLTDIKKVTTYRNSSKIIDKVLKEHTNKELNYEKYCLIKVDEQKYSPHPNHRILDDIEINSIFIGNGFLLNFDLLIESFLENTIKVIKAYEKSMNVGLKDSQNPKYDYSASISFAKKNELCATYEIISIYYLYAMLIVYFIYLNKTIDRIISESELYNIYKKLKAEIHNENYIVEKLYPIYNSLYKNEFDIVFENEEEFALLLEIITEKEKIVEKNNFIDIENSILYIDINKYINNTNENDIINKVLNEIAENITMYKQNLSINDVFDIVIYSKKYIRVIEEIKKQQAIIEQERILNGIFDEEKEQTKNLLDYSSITNGYEFETYVANLYSLLGYEVLNLTSKSGDQGADVIIEKDGLKYAVQVKFYNNPVGNKAIQEVVAAKSYYKTDKAMVVTNSTYTKQAEELAKANDVILINGEKIEQLKNEITNRHN